MSSNVFTSSIINKVFCNGISEYALDMSKSSDMISHGFKSDLTSKSFIGFL